jgi:hypothetical protein
LPLDYITLWFIIPSELTKPVCFKTTVKNIHPPAIARDEADVKVPNRIAFEKRNTDNIQARFSYQKQTYLNDSEAGAISNDEYPVVGGYII